MDSDPGAHATGFCTSPSALPGHLSMTCSFEDSSPAPAPASSREAEEEFFDCEEFREEEEPSGACGKAPGSSATSLGAGLGPGPAAEDHSEEGRGMPRGLCDEGEGHGQPHAPPLRALLHGVRRGPCIDGADVPTIGTSQLACRAGEESCCPGELLREVRSAMDGRDCAAEEKTSALPDANLWRILETRSESCDSESDRDADSGGYAEDLWETESAEDDDVIDETMRDDDDDVSQSSKGRDKEDGEGLDSDSACRFCFCSEGDDLISPCRCRGTQKFVHRSCLDEWRTAKGRHAFARCSTCRAHFHLRIPGDRPRYFMLLGASRWALHCLAAMLMFVAVQLLAVGWGYVLGRSSELGSAYMDLSTRRGVFCYCVGIWEVLFVIVVSHNQVVMRLDNWFWRGSYFGATSVLQYSVFPLAMESVFQACEIHGASLPSSSSSSFPLLNLILPPPATALPTALVPLPPLNGAWGLGFKGPAPFRFLSLLCNRRLLELSCAGAACSLYLAGVVLSLALGVILGGYAGYGLLAVMEAQGREIPPSLVQEFEVQHIEGDYVTPTFSASELRLLSTLQLLS